MRIYGYTGTPPTHTGTVDSPTISTTGATQVFDSGDVLCNPYQNIGYSNWGTEPYAERKLYSRLRHFDYSTLCIGQISIIPAETILMKLKSDYDEMAKEMMYGDVPTFAEIVDVVRTIQDSFNH